MNEPGFRILCLRKIYNCSQLILKFLERCQNGFEKDLKTLLHENFQSYDHWKKVNSPGSAEFG